MLDQGTFILLSSSLPTPLSTDLRAALLILAVWGRGFFRPEGYLQGCPGYDQQTGQFEARQSCSSGVSSTILLRLPEKL